MRKDTAPPAQQRQARALERLLKEREPVYARPT